VTFTKTLVIIIYNIGWEFEIEKSM